MTEQAEHIAQFIKWAEAQPLVRALLLTSSRTVPGALVDVFSDYDLIIVATDIRPFFEGRDWLEAFGPVLVMYRDPLMTEGGFEKSGNIVQFENDLKIDFTLWPVGLLQQVVAAPQLPPEFDAGYNVLVDKDGLTTNLKPPSYKGYIPAPPTEAAYLTVIEVFFLDIIYTAKYLWRNDMMAAKLLLDNFVKHEHMRPMLEWHAEIEHNWSVKPGPLGRRLKHWLHPDLWSELETTYTGIDLAENWDALYRSIALMRKVALEVGSSLGYTYPETLEARVMAYLQKVKETERKG